MQFTINRKKLLDGIGRLTALSAPKETIPALSYFRFQLDGKSLTVIANDLDTYQEILIDEVTAEPKIFAIHGKKLETGLKLLQAPEVTIKVGSKEITFEDGPRKTDRRFKLSTFDLTVMPEPISLPSNLELLHPSIPGDCLGSMIKLAVPTMSKLETSTQLVGVLLRTEDGRFSAVSMDNGVLNYAATVAKAKAGVNCLIPRHLASKLASAVAGLETVSVARAGNKAVFCFSDGFIAVSQSSYRAPDFDKVLRRDPLPDSLAILRSDFTKTLGGVAAFSDDKGAISNTWLIGNEQGELVTQAESDGQAITLPLGKHPWVGKIKLPVESVIACISPCKANEITFSWSRRAHENQDGSRLVFGPLVITSKESVGDVPIDFVTMHGGLSYAEVANGIQ